MTKPLASNGAGGKVVVVRLADVDRGLRMKVADEIIRRGKLRGMDAAAIALAAFAPLENPAIVVDAEKARRVLVDRKIALGSMPQVWTW